MRKPVYYKLVLQLIQPFKIIVGLDQIKVPVTSSLYIIPCTQPCHLPSKLLKFFERPVSFKIMLSLFDDRPEIRSRPSAALLHLSLPLLLPSKVRLTCTTLLR